MQVNKILHLFCHVIIITIIIIIIIIIILTATTFCILSAPYGKLLLSLRLVQFMYYCN